MAAKVIDVMDAIVTSLNAATLSTAFTAARTYRVQQHLKDLTDEAEPRVYVVPATKGLPADPSSRKLTRQVTYGIDVILAKKIDSDGLTGPDALVLLIEEIEEHLMNAGRMATGVYLGSTNAPIYSPDDFDAQQLFLSPIRFQYRVEQG